MIKSVSLLFSLILLFSCGKSRNKLEGTWTHIITRENGNELASSTQEGKNQIQFSEDGKMKYLTDGKPWGLGLYYYKQKGDSLYRINTQIDSTGKVDTLGTSGYLFAINNDTLTVIQGKREIYYKKE